MCSNWLKMKVTELFAFQKNWRDTFNHLPTKMFQRLFICCLEYIYIYIGIMKGLHFWDFQGYLVSPPPVTHWWPPRSRFSLANLSSIWLRNLSNLEVEGGWSWLKTSWNSMILPTYLGKVSPDFPENPPKRKKFRNRKCWWRVRGIFQGYVGEILEICFPFKGIW